LLVADEKPWHVVNVSSMAGRTSFPFTEAYGAANPYRLGWLPLDEPQQALELEAHAST
jgi:hypothetical protein